jgi:hypothetical protein
MRIVLLRAEHVVPKWSQARGACTSSVAIVDSLPCVRCGLVTSTPVAPTKSLDVLCCTHSVDLTGSESDNDNMAASLESTSIEPILTTSNVNTA